jgi:hypothetical protein
VFTVGKDGEKEHPDSMKWIQLKKDCIDRSLSSEGQREGEGEEGEGEGVVFFDEESSGDSLATHWTAPVLLCE